MKLFLAFSFTFCITFFPIAQIRIGYPLYLNKTIGIGEIGYGKCFYNIGPSSCIKGDLSLRFMNIEKPEQNVNAQFGLIKNIHLNQFLSIATDLLLGYSLLTFEKDIKHGMIYSIKTQIKNSNFSKIRITIGYSYQTNSIISEKLNSSIFIGLTIPMYN